VLDRLDHNAYKCPRLLLVVSIDVALTVFIAFVYVLLNPYPTEAPARRILKPGTTPFVFLTQMDLLGRSLFTLTQYPRKKVLIATNSARQ